MRELAVQIEDAQKESRASFRSAQGFPKSYGQASRSIRLFNKGPSFALILFGTHMNPLLWMYCMQGRKQRERTGLSAAVI
jgi:hypothetical protein